MTRRRAVLLAGAAIGLAAGAVWLAQGRPRDPGGIAGVAVTPDSSPSPSYLVERVAITTTAGAELSCALRRPAAPGRVRLPAFLVSGGLATGRRAVVVVDSAYGGILLACDYPWRDPSRLSALRFLLRLPRTRGEIVGTPRALALAATWLLGRKDVDSARFLALGASVGVPLVAAWAASDPRPRGVALLYGGADLRAILDANLGRRVKPAWLRRAAARLFALAAAPLEPARTVGRIAPRPLLVVASADDARIPLSSAQLLYDTAGEPKRIVWLAGAHLHPTATALMRQLTDSTVAWAETLRPGPGWR